MVLEWHCQVVLNSLWKTFTLPNYAFAHLCTLICIHHEIIINCIKHHQILNHLDQGFLTRGSKAKMLLFSHPIFTLNLINLTDATFFPIWAIGAWRHSGADEVKRSVQKHFLLIQFENTFSKPQTHSVILFIQFKVFFMKWRKQSSLRLT